MVEHCPPPPEAGRLPRLLRRHLVAVPRPSVLRLYARGGPHPTSWHAFRHIGPLAGMRFDHHEEPIGRQPERGVMYGAVASRDGTDRAEDPLPTAVLEVFGDAGVIDRSGRDHWLVLWQPVRDLRLLDLAGSDWIARAGASTALMSGPRSVARQWAAAIWAAYPTLDGITWMSSHLPPGRSLVLFERAGSALPSAPSVHTPVANPALQPALARIARAYGLVLR